MLGEGFLSLFALVEFFFKLRVGFREHGRALFHPPIHVRMKPLHLLLDSPPLLRLLLQLEAKSSDLIRLRLPHARQQDAAPPRNSE